MTNDDKKRTLPPLEPTTYRLDPDNLDLDGRLTRGEQPELDLEIVVPGAEMQRSRLNATQDVLYVVIEDMQEQRETLSRVLLKGYQTLETQALTRGVELGRRDVVAFPSAVAAVDALAFNKEVRLTQYFRDDGKLKKREGVVNGAKFSNHLIFAFVDYRMDQGDKGVFSEDQVRLFKEARAIRSSFSGATIEVARAKQVELDRLSKEFEAAGRSYTRPGTTFAYAMANDPRLVGLEFVSANIDLVAQDPISVQLERSTQSGKLPVVLYLPKSANPLADARTAFYSSLGVTRELTDVVGETRRACAGRTITEDVVRSNFFAGKYVQLKGLDRK
ncbi:hypothetical protein COY27_05930 [Candidatus Woesearchaeota archaeon CG_4_10_14_0_2_um_filter_33_13]|nr:MAG: hypothetical protein COY27_05930 [Candidatus Woesearchaeota archaeon CG_4_10_14_0_2_um_filter_33_13]